MFPEHEETYTGRDYEEDNKSENNGPALYLIGKKADDDNECSERCDHYACCLHEAVVCRGRNFQHQVRHALIHGCPALIRDIVFEHRHQFRTRVGIVGHSLVERIIRVIHRIKDFLPLLLRTRLDRNAKDHPAFSISRHQEESDCKPVGVNTGNEREYAVFFLIVIYDGAEPLLPFVDIFRVQVDRSRGTVLERFRIKKIYPVIFRGVARGQNRSGRKQANADKCNDR